jgi:hypothetical protein
LTKVQVVPDWKVKVAFCLALSLHDFLWIILVFATRKRFQSILGTKSYLKRSSVRQENQTFCQSKDFNGLHILNTTWRINILTIFVLYFSLQSLNDESSTVPMVPMWRSHKLQDKYFLFWEFLALSLFYCGCVNVWGAVKRITSLPITIADDWEVLTSLNLKLTSFLLKRLGHVTLFHFRSDTLGTIW